MSQIIKNLAAGPVPPTVATSYVTNSGTAAPAANVLKVLGTAVAAQNIPIETTGSGNTVTVVAQYASAAASSVGTNAGFSSFDSKDFTVDANGFVSASGTGFLNTLTGNLGGAIPPTANNINILTAGTTVKFSGSGSTLTQNFALSNLLIGTTGSITTGTANTSLGSSAAFSLTTGNRNVAVGGSALSSATASLNNVAVGYVSLASATTGGGQNVAIGENALSSLLTGTNNVVVGQGSGTSYTSSETNNIIIGRGITGTVSESNTIRIGNGSTTSCYVTGIDGVNVGSVARVVTEASNQLGTAIITAGTGITVIPSANAITIAVTGSASTYVQVTGPTTYAALTTDYYISCDPSPPAGIITITLPAAPTIYHMYVIKDRTGAASTNNITISPLGGVLIDGAASYVLAGNFGAITLLFNGTNYEIY